MKQYITVLLTLCLLTGPASAQQKKVSISRSAGITAVTAGTSVLPSGSTAMKALRTAGLADNQRLLGYTVTDDIDIKGACFGTAGTYSIGALLTPQVLSSYAGCRIMGIRIAAATNLGRSRTFVYAVGNKVMDPVVEQNQRLYEGWNNVFFNGEGYEISGTETLFFGFDYVETEEMATNQSGGLCGVGENTDGGFYLFQDGGLYQITGAGKLCVQLIVDVSSLPLYDLDVNYFDTGFKYKKPGETIETFVTYRNTGRAPLTNYQLGYQLDDQQPVLQDFTISEEDAAQGVTTLLAEGAMESWQFKVTLPADITLGTHQLKVFVSQAEGQPLPELSRNDEMTVSFAVYQNSFNRNKTYMEIYTDQTSPYAPFLNDAVKLLTDQYPYLAVSNIHRPGTPLAIDGAAYLHELYAYTWPTFTSNRSYFPGENYIAYDMNDYLPTIGAEMTAGIIAGIVEQDYTSPAFATIDVQAAYDADSRQLNIAANGLLLPETEDICGKLALTLMVLEDGVKGNQSVYNAVTGRTTTNRNYIHNHVLRAYMTAPLGDAIEVSDNNWSLSRSMVLDNAWSADKVKIVAFLTKQVDTVNDDNVKDVDIINCNSVSLAETMGVRNIRQQAADGSRCFDLQGRPVAQPAKGLYIVNGRKFVVK